MRFLIQKTSSYSKAKPCPEAVLTAFPNACFEADRERWCIEIESLEDLISFMDKCDEKLILKKIGDELAIEIYDTYRE